MKIDEKHTFQLPLADGNILQVENNWWNPFHPAEVFISIKDPAGKDLQDIAYIGEAYTNYNGRAEPIADTPEAIKVMVYADNEQEDPSLISKVVVRKEKLSI